MQMPVFLTLFFAPVYVPLGLLTGWIEAVAKVNPLTYVLEAVRSMLAGDEVHVALAFGIAVALIAALLALVAARAALGRGRGLGSRRRSGTVARANRDETPLGAVPLEPRTVELPRLGAERALGRASRLGGGEHGWPRRATASGRARLRSRARRRLPLRPRRARRVARPVLALAARGRARAVARSSTRAAFEIAAGPELLARRARPLRAPRRHLLAPRERSTASSRASPGCASSASPRSS